MMHGEDDFMSSEGTDPGLSNEIAEVVIDVMRKLYGDQSYVDLNLRYGIANEVQRRGLARQPYRAGDVVTWPTIVGDRRMRLVDFRTVQNQRIWILEPEDATDHEEKYSCFERDLRHAVSR